MVPSPVRAIPLVRTSSAEAGQRYKIRAGDPAGTEAGFISSAGGQLSLLANTATDPGAVDAAAAAGGRFLYVQTGGNGIVDEFSVAANGALTTIGAVTVPGAVAVELVTDYLEGALNARARRRFEAHLAGCPHCTEYLAQMRETIRLTGRLEPDDLTPQMQDEFTDLYRRWRSEQQ